MKRFALLLCWTVALGVAAAGAQGKFSGYMFGDYFYNVARDTGFSKLSKTAITPGGKDFQAFQLRRIYLTYDNDISEKFTARFRLEANMLAAEAGNTTAASRLTGSVLSQLYVKDAYLRWKDIFPGSDLIFGVQPTSAYDISETVWGYRSLEKTIMDLRGIISSRDLGIALKGKFDEGGMFSYWVMLSNNSAQDGETNKYKSASLNFQVKPVKNVIVTLFGDFRAQAKINDPASTTATPATLSNNTLTYAGFAAYNDPELITVGVEAFLQSTQNGFLDPTNKSVNSLNAFGLSVFGVYNFQSDWSAIARYDLFNPNTDNNATGSLKRSYFLGGVSYKPVKNVQIMPNVQVETYETPRNTANAPSIDASVTARLTFYWVFL